ncbi:hypothetical protein M513_13494, partial [Trichuris suis]
MWNLSLSLSQGEFLTDYPTRTSPVNQHVQEGEFVVQFLLNRERDLTRENRVQIHKPGVPLRPVVCSVNSVTSQLCTYLKGIIQPLTGGRSSHVSNHKDFCAALKSIQISKTDFM